MSYQVLARKWRPRTFREMVGQEHVLQALINALDHDRLHHAYLFTGTRGVGKTTIARILAKCLNCEVGVSSVPCNECSSCIEINEGRFVDLIEVDAASKTKVEDTRDLLENVQYAPTRGRYKVYLIDEVHMLSNSSFNALLKTLEEPPPHVKFLLATTDPQKLPVTILSRCLQFNLKNMNPERIVSHLQFVLEKEMVPFEDAALWQLARSADGSMRDALSLTDQSIAFGDGKISDADVRTMLGTIDQSLVYEVLQALIDEDGKALLTAVAALAEHAPDYIAALAELIAVLHRIAIAQALPEAVDNSQGDRQQIYDFAQAMAAEDVQLYYQTVLLGRRDLPLVPDPRSGFEMILLRMLAFKPQGVAQLPSKPLSAKVAEPTHEQATPEQMSPAAPHDDAPAMIEQPIERPPEEATDTVKKSETAIDVAVEPLNQHPIDSEMSDSDETMVSAELAERNQAEVADTIADIVASETMAPVGIDDAECNHEPAGSVKLAKQPEAAMLKSEPEAEPKVEIKTEIDKPALALVSSTPAVDQVESKRADESNHSTLTPPTVVAPSVSWVNFASSNWLEVYQALDAGGLLQSTVANCQFIEKQGQTLHFVLDEQQSTLYDQSHQQRLAELLSEYFAQTLEVAIQVGNVTEETPAQIIVRRLQERQAQAEKDMGADPVVCQLQETFDASIVKDSVEPIDQ